MIRLIAIVCLATACLGSPLPDGKIVGGDSITIDKCPYQLSLEIRGLHSCGASAISPDWAVTAGRCVEGSIGSMVLRAGSGIRESGGFVHQVDKKIIHPFYGFGTYDFDIALLRVATPFTLGPVVAFIPLPEKNEPLPNGAITKVTGWGATIEGGDLSLELQAVFVPIVNQSVCGKSFPITDRMICAGVPEGGKDACQGDTGGPLNYRNILFGVVSWGNGCARPNYPGVYTRVADGNIRDWIYGQTGI